MDMYITNQAAEWLSILKRLVSAWPYQITDSFCWLWGPPSLLSSGYQGSLHMGKVDMAWSRPLTFI